MLQCCCIESTKHTFSTCDSTCEILPQSHNNRMNFLYCNLPPIFCHSHTFHYCMQCCNCTHSKHDNTHTTTDTVCTIVNVHGSVVHLITHLSLVFRPLCRLLPQGLSTSQRSLIYCLPVHCIERAQQLLHTILYGPASIVNVYKWY